MMRSLVWLTTAFSVWMAACAPASQPASTTAPAKPAEAARPSEAAKAAAPTEAPAAKPAATSSGSLIFFSTQFKPIEEAEKMRGVILKGAPVQTGFIPEDPGPFNDRLISEQKGGKVTVSLVG